MTDAVELCCMKNKDDTEIKMAKPNNKTVNDIIQPGSDIRANVSVATVKNLAERLYGVTILEIKELPGFDDRNFFITEDPNVKNPLILDHSPSGYVFKIMNSHDSLQLPFVEAQCELLNYLNHHLIKCPKPFRNVYGHLYSVEPLDGKNHVVRLHDFISGEILSNVPKSEFLFYQVGEYLANIDRLLKDFSHTGLKGRTSIWAFEAVPELEKFKSAVKDTELLSIVDEVLKEFRETVVPIIPELEKQLIHGDVNESNVIVNLNTKSGKADDWRVDGILDFGDISESSTIYELAIAMTYMMKITGDLNSGGYVLAGYSINKIIPPEEYKLLPISVATRLVQTLVMSLYTLERDPDNKYIAGGIESSKAILIKLRQENEEDVLANWRKVADNYLTRSSK